MSSMASTWSTRRGWRPSPVNSMPPRPGCCTASWCACSKDSVSTISPRSGPRRWSGGAARSAIGSAHGRCRVHRAEILRLRGATAEAEQEALAACAELRPYLRREFGWPLTELGRIRLQLGDLQGAEEAFLAAREAGWDPEPGLARVRLAQGDVALAAASIRDALDHPLTVPSKELPPNTDLRRAPLLAARVEIDVADWQPRRCPRRRRRTCPGGGIVPEHRPGGQRGHGRRTSTARSRRPGGCPACVRNGRPAVESGRSSPRGGVGANRACPGAPHGTEVECTPRSGGTTVAGGHTEGRWPAEPQHASADRRLLVAFLRRPHRCPARSERACTIWRGSSPILVGSSTSSTSSRRGGTGREPIPARRIQSRSLPDGGIRVSFSTPRPRMPTAGGWPRSTRTSRKRDCSATADVWSRPRTNATSSSANCRALSASTGVPGGPDRHRNAPASASPGRSVMP